jgi:hypothetical protein
MININPKNSIPRNHKNLFEQKVIKAAQKETK